MGTREVRLFAWFSTISGALYDVPVCQLFFQYLLMMTYGYSWGVGATKRGLMNLAGGTMPR